MGVPGSGGGDDFLDDGNGGEDGQGDGGDDFIEASGEEVSPEPSPPAAPDASTTATAPAPAPKRRVRVKPLPSTLVQKWPNVSTMLITMRDGTQLLLVKG